MWPPKPGLDQPETGWKVKTHEGAEPFTESLAGLHKRGWWTGLRVSGTTTGQTYKVELVGLDPICTWMTCIDNNQWFPFPWPIPAGLATAMDLTVRIQPLNTDNNSLLLTMTRTSFQDLYHMSDKDHYLFVDLSGSADLVWNGKQRTWGSSSGLGVPPVWQTLHTVVPAMEYILSSAAGIPPFCIHDWSERVPLSAMDLVD
jgi:hypothetical protein